MRHQSEPGGPMIARSIRSTQVVCTASDTNTLARRRTAAPHARSSTRIPGISPGRSRPSEGLARRSRRSRGCPLLSSFGARLRSRLPQYGHSVMYGLTSDPQFLQTTKRSAPEDIASDCRAGLLPCGGDDLGHDLAQVVIGLVDHDLAGRAVAMVEEVVQGLEVAGRPQVLGVLTGPIVQAPGQLLGAHPLLGGEVDELALEAVAGGQPLVLVDHLVRVLRELLPRVEV